MQVGFHLKPLVKTRFWVDSSSTLHGLGFECLVAKQDFHAGPTIQMPRFAGGSFPRIAARMRPGLQFWGSWDNMLHVHQLRPSQGEIAAGLQGIGVLPMLDALGKQLSRKGLKRLPILLFKGLHDCRDIWNRLSFFGSCAAFGDMIFCEDMCNQHYHQCAANDYSELVNNA